MHRGIGSGGGAGRALMMLAAMALVGCAPEGQDRFSEAPSGDDPCAQGVDLSDGIQDGAEAVKALDCLNKDGQLDWLVPVVEALQASPSDAGGTLLDQWTSRLGKIGVPASTGDPAAELDRLATWMESGAVDANIELGTQAIEEGLLDAGVLLFADLARSLREDDAETRDAWRAALAWILCHGGAEEACQSPYRNLQRGIYAERLAYPPDHPDFAFPPDSVPTSRLAWMLGAGGDAPRAALANRGLARVFVAMARPRAGEDSLLGELLYELLPTIHGDDPTTAKYEGYPTRDKRQSALFGLLSAVSSPTVRQAVIDAKPESYKLLTQYYALDSRTVGENVTVATTCEPTPGPYAEGGVHGLGQLLRILSATAYDWDDPALTERCGFLVSRLLPFLSPYYELSGSHNLATITLEVFSQLPPEEAQSGADLLNHSWVVQAIRAECGMEVAFDDTEVVQAVVYMPGNMGYGQAYLRAFADARALDAVTHFLTGLWRTGAWCDLTEFLKLFDDPNAYNPPVREVDPLLPQAAGGPLAHDRITVNKMNLLADLSHQAPALLPPLERMLNQPGAEEHLAAFFTAAGRIALRPDSAFLLAHVIEAGAAQRDPDARVVMGQADFLSDRDLIELLWETASSPAVVSALVDPGPSGESALDALGKRLRAGDMPELVANVAKALRELEANLADASGG